MSEGQTRHGTARGEPRAEELRPREAKGRTRGAAVGARHWVMLVRQLVGQLALPAARARLMLVGEAEEALGNGREAMEQVL